MTVRERGVGVGWSAVGAYAATSAANQMLWLTFTPITTDSARHYGVSTDAIGWLAELFPLVYVVVSVPAGRLVDRNLPMGLGAGALLTALGAVLRLGDAYGYLLAGQVLVAVGQPFVLNAVTAVSGRFLAPDRRASGIAVSSAGVFGGMVLALLLGAALGVGRVFGLLVMQAVFAVVAALALVALLAGDRRRATSAPGAPARVSVRTVWRRPLVRRIVGLACVGFGVFVALTTWLQTLLAPAGVTSTAAGYLLLALVLAGTVTAALVPPVLARRGGQRRFLLVSVAGGVAALVLLAVAPGVGTGLVAVLVLGALLLADLPVLLELGDRAAAGAVPDNAAGDTTLPDDTPDDAADDAAGDGAATVSGLVWLAGNAAGLVAALVVQAVQDRPALAFALLAVVLLLGVPVLGRRGAPVGAATTTV